jgi:hypothetical protein
MQATQEQLDAILEAADIAELDAEQFGWVHEAVSHTMSVEQADALLAWLGLRKEWSEADFLAPEWIKEEYRFQKELDRTWLMDKTEMALVAWECAEMAGQIADKFGQTFGRQMTDVEYKLFASMYISRTEKPRGGFQRGAPPAAAASGGSPASLDLKCPKCSGPVYDNRAKKASGEYKASSPDAKCRNKDCGGVIWPAKAA